MRKAWILGLAMLAAGCATLPTAAPPDITMAGTRLFPESISADSAGNLYIGSNPGIVFRAPRGSDRADPWITPDTHNGLGVVFGVLADDARGLLWVCSNRMAPPVAASLKAFSISDGRLAADYPFPASAGPALCNDIMIDTNGDVYASDTIGARIFRLENRANEIEPWGASPEFATIDGISFGPGGALYANAIQRNTLLRVGMNSDGSMGAVEVLSTTSPMNAPDGLRPLDARRMLQSEGTGGVITVLTFPTGGGPVQRQVIASGIDYASSVTLAGGRAWYPEGKLRFMADPAADAGTFVIRSVEIPQ